MTKYVVLEEATFGDDDAQYGWILYDVGVEATSAASALRGALSGKGDLGTHYVAIPMRSWRPQRVEVETQHRLKIG